MLDTLIAGGIAIVGSAAVFILWRWIDKGMGKRAGRSIRLVLALTLICLSAASLAYLFLYAPGPIRWRGGTAGIILFALGLTWVCAEYIKADPGSNTNPPSG
jgi:hypothetical protein